MSARSLSSPIPPPAAAALGPRRLNARSIAHGVEVLANLQARREAKRQRHSPSKRDDDDYHDSPAPILDAFVLKAGPAVVAELTNFSAQESNLVEASVLSNGLAINVTSAVPGSVADISIFETNEAFHRGCLEKADDEDAMADDGPLAAEFPTSDVDGYELNRYDNGLFSAGEKRKTRRAGSAAKYREKRKQRLSALVPFGVEPEYDSMGSAEESSIFD
ncbi:hypothetical protein DYB32_009942 [Aphanomyces invadans]|uniref:Uncharacterized protein n=1 Tax=Aphanomyces invadans TaxID=157072 RepID=A0A418AHD6_9STRA|nr:hypothetical protein DYB32_009942 [Aphanomyces invadans]